MKPDSPKFRLSRAFQSMFPRFPLFLAACLAAAAAPVFAQSAPPPPQALGAWSDPRAAQNEDPGFPWGVIVANCPCFDESGRDIGRLQAGLAVERISSSRTPSGEMLRCKVLKDGVWQAREIWFRAEDVVVFDGVTYVETDPAARDTVLDYFTLLGRYDSLAAENKARSAGANPHAAEYAKAKEKHEALLAEIAETNDRIRYSNTHELPGGMAERGRLLQRANELRVLQKADSADFEAVRSRHDKWEEAHASAAPPPDTPQMRAIAVELARLRPLVRQFVPDA